MWDLEDRFTSEEWGMELYVGRVRGFQGLREYRSVILRDERDTIRE